MEHDLQVEHVLHFLSNDVLGELKQELWTSIGFAEEYGSIKGQMKNKQRLFAYMGIGGFGYKKAWLNSTKEFSPAIQKVLEIISSFFPAILVNGCMITAHLPASDKVVSFIFSSNT